MNKPLFKFFSCFFFLLIFSVASFSYSYVNGDYRTISNGNWTNGAIWNQLVGGIWTATGGTPSANDNAFVAHTVVVNSSNRPCKNLTVETTGILYTLSAVNAYMDIYGDIVCDGIIGNGSTFDGIAFNIEGSSCTVTGTGTFDPARIRKLTSLNVTTNLFINRTINLRFNSSSNTQIYDTAGTSFFNVTIGAGDTLNLTGSGANCGNASINGIDGSKLYKRGGTFTVNGVLLISGTLYMTTADTNTSPIAYTNKWIINNGGYVQTTSITCSASGASKDSLIINAGGTLELTGVDTIGVGYPFYPLSTTNNGFSFASGSKVIYSGEGNQWVRVKSEFAAVPVTAQEYGILYLSGTGDKTTSNDLYVKNDLTIADSAVLNPFSTSNIFVGGNWFNYNESGFNEQTTTVRFNGTPSTDATQLTTQYITCPGGEVYNKLFFTKGTPVGQLVLNSPVDVITQLQFNSSGSIDLNSNTLTIRTFSSTGINLSSPLRYFISEKTDNSSRIKWKIGTGTGTYNFQFGMIPGGPANNLLVKMVKVGSTDIGDVTISTYGTGQGNRPLPSTPVSVSNLYKVSATVDDSDAVVDRFWQVDATNPVATALTFTYRTAELPVTPYNVGAQIIGQWYNNAANYWQYPYIAGQTVVGNAVTVPGNTFYGAWTLVNSNSPLPVELLNFDARVKNEHVFTEWSTASEINNDYFTLEKSADGKIFIEAGKIKGAGNSSVTLNYSFVDEHPFEGVSYYRLKQTDFDGNYSYSRIVAVLLSIHDHFSLFPNPSKNFIYLATADPGRVLMSIKNIQGASIREEELELIPGNPFPVDISNLSQGIYIVELKNDYASHIMKLIKN